MKKSHHPVIRPKIPSADLGSSNDDWGFRKNL